MAAITRHALMLCAITVLACTFPPSLHAQSAGTNDQHGIAAFFSNWEARAQHAEDTEPNWLTPLITSSARVKQEFRYDMSWQSNPSGATTDNYGGGKGFSTIPIDRLEIGVNLPPYVVHNNSNLRDGFGDFSVTGKFRILSAVQERGDYALTAIFSTSFPTGSYKNGAAHAVITPTIAGGKGIGDFVFEGTFGCDLPSAQTSIVGRRFVLNNALQYRRWGRFWPEFEVNSNFYEQGPNDGRKQVYVTPGISAGHLPIHGRVTLTLDAGAQFAVTHFHSAARQAVFSVRLPF